MDGSVILHEGPEPVLRIALPRGEDEGDVIDRLDGATRFALRNAQLTALARTRLLDVRESQRRVVVASDTERRRIERDLHDCAQQRMVGVSSTSVSRQDVADDGCRAADGAEPQVSTPCPREATGSRGLSGGPR